MKKCGFIFEKIIDIENIKKAIIKASLGKREQRYVKRVLNNIGIAAMAIQKMLTNKTYTSSPYIEKTLIDGVSKKQRTICKPRFYPDQIVHWALMLQIQPIIMKGMYEYNCGSVPGRGTGYGQKALRKWLDTDYKGTKYCLKMDISKYYPSVDNGILKDMFERKIKDKECLWLINSIIDSHQGLPIGNYTSQWFANFFLQGLDHFIKEQLCIKYYIRYVDDLVLLGGNKRTLHKAREAVEKYLEGHLLKLKQDWQVFRVSKRGIDFLGFRFFYGKTILRKRNALRIRRRINKISKKKVMSYSDACAVISYWGWIKRSNSYNFYNKYVKPKIKIKTAKGMVSFYARKANRLRRNTCIQSTNAICGSA